MYYNSPLMTLLPGIYLLVWLALVIGAFLAFRNLSRLVRLQTESNLLLRELLDELESRK
ncbi:MAG TPA: hypothetical protein VGP76_20540 [Planctomycetaceae bacterium]|jgi:hypothetical protein|nr:hypothetical protein [Planctomycetaceae bacterium]